MEYPALEKFINRLGLEVTIEVNSTGFTKKTWGEFVCCHVLVSRKDKIEYSQYHCYVKGIEGPKYSEGNEVKGVREGLLGYLGEDRKVDNYFESKTRKLAQKYFSDNL